VVRPSRMCANSTYEASSDNPHHDFGHHERDEDERATRCC